MNLIESPILKTLIRMTSPSVLGLVAILSLNLVDTYFVAMLGTKELAALTYTFPLIMILMNLALGLSIGVSSVLSRALGKGERIKGVSTDAILLGLFLTTTLASITYFLQDTLFFLQGAPKDLLPFIHAYMDVWLLGLPVLAIPMIANAVLTASGNTTTPAVMMISAAVLNLALDPLLIFNYGLGIQGAALATVISYGLGLVISFFVLPLASPKSLKTSLESFQKILKVGLPAAATQMIIPLSNAATLFILSSFGESVIAAYGVLCRLESFSLIVVIALGSSLAAFAGQNVGAGHFQRAQAALKTSYTISLLYGLFLATALFFFRDGICALFSASEEVGQTVKSYLSIVPFTYGFLGCVFLANSYLNAVGKPLRASILTFSRHFLLYLPLAYVASQLYFERGVFLAMATINTSVALFLWIRLTSLSSPSRSSVSL